MWREKEKLKVRWSGRGMEWNVEGKGEGKIEGMGEDMSLMWNYGIRKSVFVEWAGKSFPYQAAGDSTCCNHARTSTLAQSGKEKNNLYTSEIKRLLLVYLQLRQSNWIYGSSIFIISRIFLYLFYFLFYFISSIFFFGFQLLSLFCLYLFNFSIAQS